MHARAVFSHHRPGKQEEAIRYVEESVAANKQEAGFKGQLFLIAQESGKVLSITLWQEEAHLHATHPAFQERVAGAAHLGTSGGALTPEVYEVAVQDFQQGQLPMYARVSTFHTRPGKTNEDVELFRESVLPLTRQQQGFNGVLYLTDASNDKGLMITLWEVEAHVKASAGGSYQQQLAPHVPRLARSPLIEVYQVHIRE